MCCHETAVEQFFFLNIIVLPFEYKYDTHFRFNPFHAVYERGY